MALHNAETPLLSANTSRTGSVKDFGATTSNADPFLRVDNNNPDDDWVETQPPSGD